MALGNSKETSNEITIEEIQELDKDSYQMVDIRDEVEISHGAIPGAMAVPVDSLMPEHLAETAGELFPAEEYISGDNSKGKKIIICCTHGTNSIPLAERLTELGYDAVSLKGGYISWLLYTMGMQEQTDICADVEKSLRIC